MPAFGSWQFSKLFVDGAKNIFRSDIHSCKTVSSWYSWSIWFIAFHKALYHFLVLAIQTVEKFFSKEIKYLVSNKREARYVHCLRQDSPLPSPESGQSSPHPPSKPHRPCSNGESIKSRSQAQADTVSSFLFFQPQCRHVFGSINAVRL